MSLLLLRYICFSKQKVLTRADAIFCLLFLLTRQLCSYLLLLLLLPPLILPLLFILILFFFFFSSYFFHLTLLSLFFPFCPLFLFLFSLFFLAKFISDCLTAALDRGCLGAYILVSS